MCLEAVLALVLVLFLLAVATWLHVVLLKARCSCLLGGFLCLGPSPLGLGNSAAPSYV